MVSDTDQQSPRMCVQRLAGDIGERNVFRPRALQAAAEFIGTQWRGQGYEVTPQVYDCAGVPCANLEVTCHGSHRPDAIVVVGAHYDSVVGSPGADDNASGIAALLGVSRRLATMAPRLTVRFVAFVNEEPPFFLTEQMGSMVYARRARARGDDIRLMISLETIGYHTDVPGSQHYPPLLGACYPDRGNFIAFVSNLGSRAQLRRTVALFRGFSDFPAERLAAPAMIPGIAWSDQASFWRYGYRALMITDSALYRYSHYHTSDDTPDKLDYAALARIIDGLALTVAALAECG